LDHEWEFKSLIKEFSLVRAAPETASLRVSLECALTAIRKRLDRERFQMPVDYDAKDLPSSKTWWYVPYCWIGCRGFIVNMDDGYVNWLGSALSLRDCFWGHQHGVVCDLVDFTFSPGTHTQLTSRLLRSFKHMHPNANGRSPSEPVW